MGGNKFATREAFDVYKIYIAIKNHFTQKSYDFHKYNGKTKTNLDNLKKRKDVSSFYRLSKHPEYPNVILSNIVEDPKRWIGDICSQSVGLETYKNWLDRVNKMHYSFVSEVKKLDQENFKQNFIVKDGQHPFVMRLLLKKEISLETFAIIMDITNVEKYWRDSIKEKIISEKIIDKSVKYVPFLSYDKDKYKCSLRNTLENA